MRHKHYSYVKSLIDANMPVLLRGGAGTGKTTVASQISEDLELPFYVLSMTKQTTLSHIVGFKSINGEYIDTLFRKAFEHGGVFLLDELDAADPNVVLCFNTIENGFMAFPDKIVEAHEDFKLIATANPANSHSIYTGRANLDFSTTDRFIEVEMDRDHALEESLTDEETVIAVEIVRELLEEMGITREVTMRDAIRYHKVRTNDLKKDPHTLLFKDNYSVSLETSFKSLLSKKLTSKLDISNAKSFDELITILDTKRAEVRGVNWKSPPPESNPYEL